MTTTTDCPQCAPTGGVPNRPCKATGGRWHCPTCHETPPNNWAASTHEEAHPGHEVVWFCHEHGVLEAAQ